MTIWLIKDDQGRFVPYQDVDRELAAKIPAMEENAFTIKRIRNPKFHRKFFGLIKLAFENQDHYTNMEDFRLVMQMKSGYFKRVVTDKGVTFLPISISFENMDETEFSELYDKVFKTIMDTYRHDSDLFTQELSLFI